jgi:hypothetical protein
MKHLGKPGLIKYPQFQIPSSKFLYSLQIFAKISPQISPNFFREKNPFKKKIEGSPTKILESSQI